MKKYFVTGCAGQYFFNVADNESNKTANISASLYTRSQG